ncbi:MAG: hypothetical protein WCR27_04460 [Eubacteriales bacterium]
MINKLPGNKEPATKKGRKTIVLDKLKLYPIKLIYPAAKARMIVKVMGWLSNLK